jgi:hypothetical protein
LRHRAVALEELITAVSEEQPLAILIDDVQWADERSCRVLGTVLEHLRSHPVLIVTAGRRANCRTPEVDSTTRVELQPFDHECTRRLILRVGDLPAEALGSQSRRRSTPKHGWLTVALDRISTVAARPRALEGGAEPIDTVEPLCALGGNRAIAICCRTRGC